MMRCSIPTANSSFSQINDILSGTSENLRCFRRIDDSMFDKISKIRCCKRNLFPIRYSTESDMTIFTSQDTPYPPDYRSYNDKEITVHDQTVEPNTMSFFYLSYVKYTFCWFNYFLRELRFNRNFFLLFKSFPYIIGLMTNE